MHAQHTQLADLIRSGARQHPDAPLWFLADDGTPSQTTVGDVYESALALAAHLQAAGLGTGDAVAIWGGSSIPVATGIVAALIGGFVAVPMLHTLGEADVNAIVERAQCRAVIAGRGFRDRRFLPELQRLAERNRSVTVIADDEGAAGRANASSGQLRSWDDVMTAPVTSFEAPTITADNRACIFFTSGSSGQPKGVIHAHRSLVAEVFDWGSQLGVLDGSVFLQSFPIAHVGGIEGLVTAMGVGTPAVLLESWHGELAAHAIERHRVTAMGSTPFFVDTLIAAHDRGADLSSIRRIMTGGAMVTPQLIAEADKRGLFVFRCYGSSEHPTVTGTDFGEGLPARSMTDGRPSGDSEVLIIDERGEPLPSGASGEVLLRGSEQFVGYLGGGTDALDSDAIDADGWFHTGDVGRIDGDGRLTITGRIKQIIIRAGENISIAEVEEVLAAHGAVRDCAVIGINEPVYGERACAVVVTRDGSVLDLADVRAHFEASGLARFKVPEYVMTVAELPHNTVGKIDRNALRAALNEQSPFG